jgi:hypothetical protein
MIKTIRDLDRKISNSENDTLIYQKEKGSPEITLYPANIARMSLAKGYQKNLTDDTDEIPSEIYSNGSHFIPVVCAPPQLEGCVLPGVIDTNRNSLTIYDCATHDPCKAARVAHTMIVTSPRTEVRSLRARI